MYCAKEFYYSHQEHALAHCHNRFCIDGVAAVSVSVVVVDWVAAVAAALVVAVTVAVVAVIVVAVVSNSEGAFCGTPCKNSVLAMTKKCNFTAMNICIAVLPTKAQCTHGLLVLQRLK